ncbi:hypothetical protein ACLO87_05420 [Paenalcaligenes sp. Me52]|uniref:hypothetical protein n=1 Tax=Paenalcaligenes sp. Me52 TaxID=3392038 RepID=UPI003D295725
MLKIVLKFIPYAVALLCGLLIIPWVLGVPGNFTPRTQLGWTTGLIAMVVYLVLYQIAKSTTKFSSPNKTSLATKIDSLLLIAACCVLPVMAFALVLLVCE